jgi:hypothetical protein
VISCAAAFSSSTGNLRLPTAGTLQQACCAGLLRRPAASSSIAKRSIASIATIDAAANAAGESGAAFANFQHR